MAGYLEPLKIRKASQSQSVSSYPFIPRRQSSLCESLSSEWSGAPTSTRTPSLDDTLYQLHVKKIRKPAKGAHTILHDSFDEGSVNEDFTEPPQSEVKSKNGNRFVPRLILRWSSGSWNRNGSLLSPFSPVASADLLCRAPAYRQFWKKQKDGHPKIKPFNSLAPMNSPISCVNVRSTAEKPQISMLATSLWTQVHISVGLDSAPISVHAKNPSLDIIILLDSAPQSPMTLLAQSISASFVLISNLDQDCDRVALAVMNADADCGYELLLSLGFHTIEDTCTTLDAFPQRKNMKSQELHSDVGKTIQQISTLFSFHPRQAFCHIFFVSARPPENLSVPFVNPGIGIHTVTPHHIFPVEDEHLNGGCHIPHHIDTSGDPQEMSLIKLASQVFHQLRTGLNPGFISDVRLFVCPSEGCQIVSDIKDFGLVSLRPGETWTVPIQFHIPAQTQHTCCQLEQSAHPTVEELITEIDYLLMDDSPRETTQPIFTVFVEYKHSLLPASSTVHNESAFTIVRRRSDS